MLRLTLFSLSTLLLRPFMASPSDNKFIVRHIQIRTLTSTYVLLHAKSYRTINGAIFRSKASSILLCARFSWLALSWWTLAFSWRGIHCRFAGGLRRTLLAYFWWPMTSLLSFFLLPCSTRYALALYSPVSALSFNGADSWSDDSLSSFWLSPAFSAIYDYFYPSLLYFLQAFSQLLYFGLFGLHIVLFEPIQSHLQFLPCLILLLLFFCFSQVMNGIRQS